ncbi:MAG: sulfite exporter TauE/SafE family protein [Anaerolineae bacterium]|nr:sulfite exporter TauE/SafE family protein [Anaerolineae bacterium]
MEWYLYAAVIGAGFLAGFVNSLAGSGSLVTLPILIFIGLPATIANGTNRVAILMQNIVGVGSFKQQGKLDGRAVFLLGFPAVLGAILGAQIAVNLDEEAMRKAIGAVMVLMLVVIVMRPKRWLAGQTVKMDGNPGIGQLALFFFIGVYGGFIQAGVGIFLLAGLVLGAGYDLVRANAVKLGIVLFFTIAALAVFVFNEQVRWGIGLVMGIGNMGGAWVGTRFAVEKGTVWVRRVLITIVAFSAASLLGILDTILAFL